MGFSIRSRGADFVGNDQSVLATEFFDNSRRSIAHESGVVDLSTKAGPIGDDVHVVDVFCGAYTMVGPMRTDVITAPSLGPQGRGSKRSLWEQTDVLHYRRQALVQFKSFACDRCTPCIQTDAACLARKSIVDSLMHLRTRITAFATPRSPNRRTTKSARSCVSLLK